jgi:putative endonuclease
MRSFVYVLRSTSADRLNIGSSAKPDARLKSHNFGRVCSTKAWRPWERVLLEEYPDRATAEKRERYLKSGWVVRNWRYFWRGGGYKWLQLGYSHFGGCVAQGNGYKSRAATLKRVRADGRLVRVSAG